jgi:outer membrane protein assembly factor BamB
MTEDFVTTLRTQLREAAEREARRSPLMRALPRPRSLVWAGAVAAAAVVIALLAATLGGPPKPLPTAPAPHVVARLAIADKGGLVSTGFGSLWTYDAVSGDVLRLSPDGSVVARIKTESDILDGWAGAGAMWALSNTRVYRIDPETNRVVARIRLPLPTRSHNAVVTFPGAAWVLGVDGMQGIDLKTNRLRPLVAGERVPTGFTADATRWYVTDRDGELTTYDGVTFRQLDRVRLPVAGLPLVAAGDDVIVSSAAGVAAVDPKTGALRWRTNLGVSRANGAAAGLGAIWVQGTPVSGRDQLWKLDPKTGRVLSALRMSDFGVTGMITTRDRLWIMSPTGVLTAFR